MLRCEPLQEFEQAIGFRAVAPGHCIYSPPAPHGIGRMSLVCIHEPYAAVGLDHLNECPEAHRVESTLDRIARTRQRRAPLPLYHPRERLDEKVVWTGRIATLTSSRFHVLHSRFRLLGLLPRPILQVVYVFLLGSLAARSESKRAKSDIQALEAGAWKTCGSRRTALCRMALALCPSCRHRPRPRPQSNRASNRSRSGLGIRAIPRTSRNERFPTAPPG